MKIAFVSHSAALGGAEWVLVELIRGLVPRGIAVDVVLPHEGPLRDELSAAGACVCVEPHPWWMSEHREPLQRLGRLRRLPGAVRRLRRRLRSLAPQVVVSNSLTVPAAALAAHTLGLPHVWYVHELLDRSRGLRFDLGRTLSLRLLARLSLRVLVPSQAVQEEIAARLKTDRLRRLYCAPEVPAMARAAAPTADFRLVLVGEKCPYKGQDEAIRATALLRRRGVPAHLTLVGGGTPSYEARLQALAREQAVSGAVSFLPFTRDRLRVLGEADLALVCSRAEAFGRVTVEAMKLGRAVVGARSGATPELIRHDWNGCLYPGGDVVALTDTIERLYRDPALRATLARQAQAWATETFTASRHVDAFLQAIREALEMP